MNNTVLALTIRWLPAVDAFAASCVSRDWNAALSSEQDETQLWKQVGRNTNPLVMADVKDDASIDFRRFALGLTRETCPDEPKIPSVKPKLRPEDIFAVVEIHRRKQVDGKRRRVLAASWVSELSEGLVMSDREVVFKGTNPYSSLSAEDLPRFQEGLKEQWYGNSFPPYFALRDAMGEGSFSKGSELELRVTLFRRDNMKSTCVMYDHQNRQRTPPFGINDDEEIEVLYNNNGVFEPRFDLTNQGHVARALMDSRFDGAQFDCRCDVTMKPVLPSPESGEEPEWLRNAQQARQERKNYLPDQSDEAALRDIPHFDIEITRFDIEFYANSDNDQDELDEEETMIALEGLCWR